MPVAFLFDRSGLQITPGLRSSPKPAAHVLMLRTAPSGSAMLDRNDVRELQRVLAEWLAITSPT
jgi:hypothetical protein